LSEVKSSNAQVLSKLDILVLHRNCFEQRMY